MKVLDALAEIEDLKDFRLKNVMMALELDPHQPVLFYRLLMQESREVARAMSEREALRREATNLRNTYDLLEKEKRESLRSLTSTLNAWRRKADIAETDRRWLVERLEERSAERDEALTRLANYERILQSLRVFLLGDSDTAAIYDVLELLRDVYWIAASRKLRGKTPMDLELENNVERVRQFLRLQLAAALGRQ
jgi:hypothetical protein